MIRTLAADLFAFRSDGRRRRLALFAVVLLILAWPVSHRWPAPPTNLGDGHAVTAMELAMTRAYCGAPSAYPNPYRVPHYLREHPSETSKPLVQVIAEQAGSVEAYCKAAVDPFINNENSLTVLMAWILELEPGLSTDGLGLRLYLLRALMLVVFAVVCVANGLGVVFGTALLFVGVGVFRTMDGASHSLYPFLLPLLLAHVSGYAISWRWWRGGRLVPVLVVSAIAGFVTGFSSNLRTSYLPVWIALFAITLLAATAAWSGFRSAKIWRAAAGCVVFGVSFWVYQYWFIDRHLPPKFHYNASYHTVAHPLVLSLANPPSDLSRREGIEWSDGAGERIAQRIDPQATYLGNTYDKILFQYYRDLWRKHPGEMAGIYLMKFSATGVPIIDAMRGYSTVSGRVMRWLLTPLAVLRSGILLILCCLAVAGGAFIVSRRSRGVMPILIAMLCASAVLLLMESAIIHPNFAPQYHGYLMMFFPMITLFGIQGVVQIVLGPALGTASHPARKTAQYFDAISDDFEARMNPFDLRSRMDWFDRSFDRFAPGRLVLDVGSGLGHFADLARARGAIVVPLDLAPRLVSRLKTRYSAAVCASATSLPFLEGTFDAVISSECIEHTPDPPLAVAEMLRVLKRGGRLYVTTPNLVWRWSVWLAERLGVRQFEGIENWLSRATLRRTLADNGAIVEVSEGLHILPFQLRPLWPVIGWMNARGQWAKAVMINQCWIARK